MQAEQIANMSTTQKIALMEALWDSFENKSEHIPSPDWHGEILSERKALIDSGAAKYISLEDLKRK